MTCPACHRTYDGPAELWVCPRCGHDDVLDAT